MKFTFSILSFILITLYFSSCKEELNDFKADISVDRNGITKSFNDWYKYSYYQVKLSEDFIALDIDSLRIGKEAFMEQLISKDVIAFKIGSIKERSVYKLIPLNTTEENISQVSKQSAKAALKNFKMEGQLFPTLTLTDLNNNVHDSLNRKDKIIVYKCWFTSCVACVAEFPELNKLVEEYKGNKDVEFISLAMDDKEPLKKFLSTRTFEYSTIPMMKKLMMDDLLINSFPTHIVVGRDGRIKKVVGTATELISFLEKELPFHKI